MISEENIEWGVARKQDDILSGRAKFSHHELKYAENFILRNCNNWPSNYSAKYVLFFSFFITIFICILSYIDV